MCSDCSDGKNAEANLEAIVSWLLRSRGFWLLLGVVVGAFVGSGIGIAGFGGAIAGTVPLAVIGGYIGYRIGTRLRGDREARKAPAR